MKESSRSVLVNWSYWKHRRADSLEISDYLLVPEIERLVDDPTSVERRFLFETLWRTGGKIGEVLDLRTSDFYLEKGEERVCLGGEELGRMVEIVSPAYLALVNDFLRRCDSDVEDPLIVITRQTASNWLSRRVKAVRQSDPLLLPDMAISFNTIRNSFAFHAIVNAVPLDTLQRWLGHNQAKMTRRYMRFLGDDSRVHMERMSL